MSSNGEAKTPAEMYAWGRDQAEAQLGQVVQEVVVRLHASGQFSACGDLVPKWAALQLMAVGAEIAREQHAAAVSKSGILVARGGL